LNSEENLPYYFLNSNEEFVSSGSFDKFYIWNRHYGNLVYSFNTHSNSHNYLIFNPVFKNFFITISDDNLLKLFYF
jgi:hypothetical protein